MAAHKIKNLNRNNISTYVPLLSLEQCRRSYFIHESKVYNVESAPAEVFKAAIRACIDLKRLADSNMLLEATSVLDGPDDDLSRWYLLCYVAKSLPLFASREQAEQAQQTHAENSASSNKIKQPSVIA